MAKRFNALRKKQKQPKMPNVYFENHIQKISMEIYSITIEHYLKLIKK